MSVTPARRDLTRSVITRHGKRYLGPQISILDIARILGTLHAGFSAKDLIIMDDIQDIRMVRYLSGHW
jgi:hypothetical protein